MNKDQLRAEDHGDVVESFHCAIMLKFLIIVEHRPFDFLITPLKYLRA